MSNTSPRGSTIPVSLYSLYCDSNPLSLMNFLYNQRCVQIICGNGRLCAECLAKIMRYSQNITFYERSMAWLLNRNIYAEEKSTSYLTNELSTKYCEIYLIFLKNFTSFKSIVSAATTNISTPTLFPYSKLYFIIEDIVRHD